MFLIEPMLSLPLYTSDSMCANELLEPNMEISPVLSWF
jgi:hypothetical protein